MLETRVIVFGDVGEMVAIEELDAEAGGCGWGWYVMARKRGIFAPDLVGSDLTGFSSCCEGVVAG